MSAPRGWPHVFQQVSPHEDCSACGRPASDANHRSIEEVTDGQLAVDRLFQELPEPMGLRPWQLKLAKRILSLPQDSQIIVLIPRRPR